MEAILLGLHVVLAMALIGIVLIQRSEQDGFGLGSGSGSNFMTGRQSANFLTRSTAILATLFMVNSLVLTIMAAGRSDISIVDRIEASSSQSMGGMAREEIKAKKGISEPKPAEKDIITPDDEAPMEELTIPAAPKAE